MDLSKYDHDTLLSLRYTANGDKRVQNLLSPKYHSAQGRETSPF